MVSGRVPGNKGLVSCAKAFGCHSEGGGEAREILCVRVCLRQGRECSDQPKLPLRPLPVRVYFVPLEESQTQFKEKTKNAEMVLNDP